MDKQRAEHFDVTPFDEAQQHLRYLRAKCDVLFTLVGQDTNGPGVGELEKETLANYLSEMLDSCGALRNALNKVERTSRAAA